MNFISRYWRRLSFRLPFLIAAFSAITGVVAGGIAIRLSDLAFVEVTKDKVEVVRNERARAVSSLVENYRINLSSLSTRFSLALDLNDLSRELVGADDAARNAIIASYTDKSPYPAGSRSAVYDAGDGSSYSAKHRQIHERFLRLAQIQDLRDILLVDVRGNVVYSVMKAADFGTNLLTGEYKDTNAAKVFRDSLATAPPWNQVFADMEIYGPVGGPALFMGQAVHDGEGAIVGAVIFHLNTNSLRQAANHIQDLGETGEVYLVGADGTRRSQTRFAQDPLLDKRINTESANRAAGGFTGKTLTQDYKGDDVVSAYAPINLLGVQWGIVSKIDLREATAPIRPILANTIGAILLCTLVIVVIGYASARQISRPLDRSLRVMEKLSRGDLNVELESTNGIAETRQIAEALRAFHGNMVETRRLVEEVTKGQEQLTALLDSSPTGILVISTNAEVLFVNDPAATILGRGKSSFVGTKFTFEDIAVSRYEANRIVNIARREGSLKEARLVVRIEEKGETTLSLTIRRTLFKGAEAFLIWFNDITEQLRADEELRQLNDRFVAFLENTPDFISIRDLEGRFQAVSQSFATTYARASYWRDLLGKKPTDIFPSAIAANLDRGVEEFLRSGQQLAETEEMFAIGGQEFCVAMRRVALRTRGQTVGTLVIARDISAQKKAEDAVKAALREAEAERKRSEKILDSAPDPVVIVNNSGTIDYVNHRTLQMFGYEPSELIKKSIEILVPKRAHAAHDGHVRHFFRAGQARQMGTNTDLFAVTKSGAEVPVEISLSPLVHNEEKLVIASLRDISDRRAAQVALTKAKEDAEAATKAKGDFLASMSHEIRTPMNGIIGMADLMAQSTLDDDQRHMLKTIRESGNALITVINDILDFSKIEAGKLDLENLSMSVADVVEGVASTLTPNATKKGIRIHTFVDPEIPMAVMGDPVRVRQVLFNLAGNAVKFSEKKDVELRARVSKPDDSGRQWVQFDVIDYGIGISEENQAKLFQAFSQAESSTTRKFGGTGLGLVICKRLVEMMDGRIILKSRLGEGSKFTAEIPFKVAESARTNEKRRDLSDLRVVVVASRGVRSEALMAYLAQSGAVPVAVADEHEAIEVVRRATLPSEKISSLVFDFELDAPRQHEALKVFRDAIPTNRPPVILMQDYQMRDARIAEGDVVTVDANPIIRYRIVTAVAVAAGRASPQIKPDAPEETAKPGKVPTVEEARASGQLILLAEDNLTNQDVIRRQLSMLGYACEIANNGAEGLAAARKGHYALILTDCHMPEMDGYEMTGQIRQEEKASGKRTPIIAVTANALEGEAERCIAAGMDDYISKPIAMPVLRTKLAKWMPKRTGEGQVSPVPLPVATSQTLESGTSDEKVVDERVIKEMFGDDATTFKEIMMSFVGPSRDTIGEITAAWRNRDPAGVRDAAHKLKSAARSVGANSLADTCAALEKAGKAADWSSISELAPRSELQFAAVATYIDSL